MLFYALGLFWIVLVIGFSILIPNLMIKKTIKEFVAPLLTEKGLQYTGYKWAGFFSHGDFKNDDVEFSLITSKNGKSSGSVYSFIYYRDVKLDLDKSVTIRIDLSGFSIENVIYSAAV